MVDIIIASAPKAFLGISGWQDILMQPSGMAEAHLAMREGWKMAGAEHKLGSPMYDAPHEFNAEMQRRAISFPNTFL